MSIKDRLIADMKQAMKDREAGKTRLSVIRMVRASIKNAEVERKRELTEEEVLEVLNREVKLRREALEEYKKGNRPELCEALENEISVLQQYLPQQLTEEEIRAMVREAIRETGASGPKDLGKVMSVLMPKVKGRADGKAVNAMVRGELA